MFEEYSTVLYLVRAFVRELPRTRHARLDNDNDIELPERDENYTVRYSRHAKTLHVA